MRSIARKSRSRVLMATTACLVAVAASLGFGSTANAATLPALHSVELLSSYGTPGGYSSDGLYCGGTGVGSSGIGTGLTVPKIGTENEEMVYASPVDSNYDQVATVTWRLLEYTSNGWITAGTQSSPALSIPGLASMVDWYGGNDMFSPLGTMWNVNARGYWFTVQVTVKWYVKLTNGGTAQIGGATYGLTSLNSSSAGAFSSVRLSDGEGACKF